MVLYLRENKNVALHVICGDITDVSLIDGRLIIKTNEQYLFDIVSSKENEQEIKKAISWQGLDLELEFVKTKKEEELIQEDFNKLKNLGIKFRKV